jgi:hypothetical protein
VKSNIADNTNKKPARRVAFADEPNSMTGGVGTENDDKV